MGTMRTKPLALKAAEAFTEFARARQEGGKSLAPAVRAFGYCALLARDMGLETVPIRIVRLAVEQWNKKAAHKRGEFSPKKTVSPSDSPGALFAFWYRWHNGYSANLGGPIMRAGWPYSGGFDSIVQVATHILSGGKTQAVQRWHTAIYGT